MNSDPFSLDRLQDIVQREPVSWWPPAAIWWCLAVLGLFWLICYGIVWIFRWHKNAYRRAAVRELETLSHEPGKADGILALELSALLKRVAMVAYPRPQVASLSGQQWSEFLVNHSTDVDAQSAVWRVLGQASQAVDQASLQPAQRSLMLEQAAVWIRSHDREAGVAPREEAGG